MSPSGDCRSFCVPLEIKSSLHDVYPVNSLLNNAYRVHLVNVDTRARKTAYSPVRGLLTTPPRVHAEGVLTYRPDTQLIEQKVLKLSWEAGGMP